jgi:hypothetical protein
MLNKLVYIFPFHTHALFSLTKPRCSTGYGFEEALKHTFRIDPGTRPMGMSNTSERRKNRGIEALTVLIK